MLKFFQAQGYNLSGEWNHKKSKSMCIPIVRPNSRSDEKTYKKTSFAATS